MLEGQQTQQPQPQEVQPQPAPLYAPEQPEPAFTFDEGKVPLHTALWARAKRDFTTGWDLINQLDIRKQNAEKDINHRFIGYLSQHRVSQHLMDTLGIRPLPDEKFLSSQEYEQSEYKRPTLNFPNGVYENLAQEEADHYDKKQITADLNARTDQGTWPTIAKGATSLAAGFANPLFLAFGGAVGHLAAPATHALVELLPQLKFLEPEAQAIVKKFTESTVSAGLVEMPAFQTLDVAEAKLHQENVSWWSVVKSMPAGLLFGAIRYPVGAAFRRGIGALSEGLERKPLSSERPELKSDFAKEKGMNEPHSDEPEPIVDRDPIPQSAHEEAFKTSVSQMENGKLPEVGEIVKQQYHDSWEDNVGEKAINDPEGYAKEVEDLQKSKEINQSKIDDIQNEVDRITKKIKTAKEPFELVEKRDGLFDDLRNLEDKNSQIDDQLAIRENRPEPSDMGDVHDKVDKMQSEKSDFSYQEPKEPVEIPKEDKSVNDFLENERAKFNERKAEMDPKLKEAADARDIREQNKGTNKFLNAIVACLVRRA